MIAACSGNYAGRVGDRMTSKRMRLVLCGLVGIAAASPALAGHYEVGQRAYIAHDYATASREWQAGADAGELDSTYELSVMFRDGEGVPKDQAKGFALALRAAEAGYYLARQGMTNYYHKGIGIKVDDVEATRWVKRGADQGDSNAMRDYAYALRTGIGVPVDKAAAVDWYERSFLYDDFSTAHVPMIGESDWSKYPFTTATYDELIEKGDLPKPDLPARFHTMLARADGGDAEAQFEVAMMYFVGRGTRSDRAKTVDYLKKAADQDHAMAQLRLANTYIQGVAGNPHDEAKAAYWLRRSAVQKNPFALTLLGGSYFGGHGVIEDDKLGFALMMLGAFYGDRDAAKIAMRARLSAPAALVDAANVIAYRCIAQGIVACLPES